MDNNMSFSLITIDASLAEKKVINKILLCNEETKRYGLLLTESQAEALAQTRTASLKENKRIEFSDGVVDKLIIAMCDSAYITQEIYENTIHEMINLFYDLKNNTWDMVSDNDLIDFIKTAFNGCCRGTMELLIEKSTELAEHIHCGKKFETFDLEEK